jgi:hypothetical protein
LSFRFDESYLPRRPFGRTFQLITTKGVFDMATSKEIQTLDYVKEGVRYTIHVEEGEGGVKWGTWNCRECGTGGSSARKVDDIDGAIGAAKLDLERHHISNHGA